MLTSVNLSEYDNQAIKKLQERVTESQADAVKQEQEREIESQDNAKQEVQKKVEKTVDNVTAQKESSDDKTEDAIEDGGTQKNKSDKGEVVAATNKEEEDVVNAESRTINILLKI